MATQPGRSTNEIDYRITLGAYVNARLQMNPKAFRIPCNNLLDIYIVRDFLDERDCREMMALIDADNEPSKLLSYNGDQEFRTSYSCNVDPENETVRRVEARITALMGIDSTHGETIQGQRYQVGQQFKPHYDFFHKGEAYWDEMMRSGGQRTWTAMAFLNSVEAGGQTFFERAGVRITPKAGNLLMWNNLDLAGEPNMYSLHQGMPVEAGVKYIVTKWFRGRKWGYPAEAA